MNFPLLSSIIALMKADIHSITTSCELTCIMSSVLSNVFISVLSCCNCEVINVIFI